MKDIVDLILRVNVGGYSFEMANPRHGYEWRVWETVKLPDGKVLLPGVISHATNVVEHPELVAERLVWLARLVGPERVIASADCGFAQGPFGRRVHPSIMWAKLRAFSEGAAIASRVLGLPGLDVFDLAVSILWRRRHRDVRQHTEVQGKARLGGTPRPARAGRFRPVGATDGGLPELLSA